eukprot:CAMPEP_0203899202 /NCGR_PEP_ID=MMETSP0359-20131031/41642_1 /ASSEMBLY_ACC=CAM_ASM_000338 /TAXON_ID=268821 /ORGANISM="Scrippsiella Hangoei, Strain SHTV-5" /LENGTH=717 /DNA_ID=CAMNT_0050822411 /DNA_START=65 /DNA_END=2218 /DNA_ORIENTATION=-
MPRKCIVGGNWKCNPATIKEANDLIKAWKKNVSSYDKEKVDVVICPPALWLFNLKEQLSELGFSTSSQNVSKTGPGAFTGEWTAESLVDLGLSWTLIGHSERRVKYGETDADTAAKVERCQEQGLNVIFCIGETLEEREGGKTDEVNKRMLAAVLPKIKDWSKIVIAYEPVWAIGTGKVATPDQAEETHAAIRAYLKTAVSAKVADDIQIQYGGSVTPENCKELIGKPNIDGFLVGGASLKPTFMDIVSACGPSKLSELWPAYQAKMEKEGCNEAAIAAFKYNLGVLASGANVMIPESAIDPVESLMDYEQIKVKPDSSLLKQTVVLKLNGGLGTGMGLDKAKSLLTVTEGNSFLDLIAKQVGSMNKQFKTKLKFMLMNSFATSADTLEALAEYKDLGKGSELEFVQNKAPKVTASDLTPATWEKDSSQEWCPPGHGDLYPAMLGSGTLDKLLKKGFKYMFVSNSDNLGATMDLKILAHFASTGAPFMMEVATRTDADKKGGHLAKDKKTGALLLRESAQCPEEDEKAFQDTGKYKYFNTNNLWVDLVALKACFKANDGSVPLPVMKNAKTVDPRDKASTKVLQLETAMGAAIQCFDGATALVIPRSRFAPVKTTNDLFALRSDAYTLTKDFRITLAEARKDLPPDVKLDGMYKFTDAMEKLIPNGPPSLIDCKQIVVEGDMSFAKDVIIKGSVTFKNSGASKEVPSGTYEDKTVDL